MTGIMPDPNPWTPEVARAVSRVIRISLRWQLATTAGASPVRLNRLDRLLRAAELEAVRLGINL